MKLLLKDFQKEYLDELVRKVRQAAEEAAKNELQAVSLSSPTGSGKTAIVTAAIERLLEGDDEHRADRRATFLWITDQPELNEQTRRKMLDTSSVLGLSKLSVIDASFDEETFKPGVVYFLNTQKLGKEKYLVTRGDDRTFSIWETITNTVNDRPGSFYVFIDEAHRGMTESTRERNEANTIIQKFIKGSPGEIPRIPLIVGISATPERFNRLIEGGTITRTSRPVVVDPQAVRASGLLKEIITLYHPTERQPSDMTMLRAAARSWQGYCKQWARYSETQGEPAVRPILVVQVQDGSGKQLSRTDIAEVIEVIDDQVGPLPATAFAHAFQEGSALEIGDHQLRYLAPADIQLDGEIQVIFFKTSLNTGWDCPRAEVMMSFRTAIDATYIAQLVGRMVRTPLTRRIDSDEFLNTVALYLPHYDEEGLDAVIERLTTPDPDILPPVRIEKGEDMVALNRARRSEKAFAVLAELPSYAIPRSRKTSQVRRLMKLSRALAHDEIRENAPEKATDLLVRILRGEYRRARRTKHFKSIVEETEKLDVRAVKWRLGEDDQGEAENIELEISAENIEDVFDSAGRKVGEGLHKAWWRARVEEEPRARRKAKLELFALCSDPQVIERVESTAQKTVQTWLREHRSAIDKLAEARRQSYDEVRRLAAKPELTPLSYPNTIELKKGDDVWTKHLYVDEESGFPVTFDSWERKVVAPEIDRDEVIGWLRNIDRKPWALCVPYQSGGQYKPFYPDFLVIRSTRDGLVVDLLDPHSIHLEDAPAKASGLAQYAALHGVHFDRIELIIVDGDRTKRLNLNDERTREKVMAVTAKAHLQQLFDWGPSGER